MSLRKSIKLIFFNHFALLIIKALLGRLMSKSKNFFNWFSIENKFSSISKSVKIFLSSDFPLGSPINPVPPPTRAIGVWPVSYTHLTLPTIYSV